jgi:phosphomannomutase
VNPGVFHTYDIRGTFRRDFDVEFAQRLGARVAAYLKADTIVIGRDQRASSDELAYAVIDGALQSGARVVDVGELASPQCYWAIRALGAAGGIMVTASHNPARENGFKVIGRNGEIIGGEHLRQIYDSPGTGHRSGGAVEYFDAVPGYADAIAYAAGWQGGRELRLAVEGPPSILRVLERMGPIALDHGLAARFDSDGDRVTFYDAGVPVPAEWVFLLLAERLHLAPLVFDLRFSRAIRERLDKRRIPYTLSRVGRLALTEAMRATGAGMGGETSGHLYWKEFGGMEAPELTLLRVYSLIAESRYALSDLIAPYRRYYKGDEVAVPIRDNKQARHLMEHIARSFPGCLVDRLDGITLDCWKDTGWWANIRPSHTEPLLRVTVEAKTKKMLNHMISQLQEILRRQAA